MTTLDWDALARAVKDRRRDLRMRQVDLAEQAGVSEATIQKIEKMGGGVYSKPPSTLKAICQALGWTPDSGGAILEGGMPEVVTDEPARRPAAAAPPPDEFADGMPHRMRQELRRGQIVDSEITEVTRPGGGKFLLVWKTDADREDISPEDIAEWARIQRALRGLPTGDDEDE